MIARVLELSSENDCFVATTGKTSREINELRIDRNETPDDFLVVGRMGHASSVALGVALEKPHRQVVCFDGDGALLMHMGAMPIIGTSGTTNLVHIVLNNGSHESAGGFPTAVNSISLKHLGLGSGYAS